MRIYAPQIVVLRIKLKILVVSGEVAGDGRLEGSFVAVPFSRGHVLERQKTTAEAR